MRDVYSDRYDAQVGNSIFRQTDRESSLVDLMRVNVLKRMESSIHSFALTIENILNQVNGTIKAIDDFNHGDTQQVVTQNVSEFEDDDEDVDAFFSR